MTYQGKSLLDQGGVLTIPAVVQAWVWPVNRRRKADAKCCTHLAINFGRSRRTTVIEHGINYDNEAGQARNSVNLLKGQIQTRGRKVRPYSHVPISSSDSVVSLG